MEFDKPPVVETVLSVQFKPIKDLGAGLLGKFWASLGDEWPHCTDTQSIEPEYEHFGPENVWQREGFRFKLSSQVDLRLQIFNAKRDRMIQVQNGRFLFNWIGTGENYPRYETVRPEFDLYWGHFREFLASSSEQTLELDQWEVVYVNHIAKSELWSTYSEAPKLFTFIAPVDLEAAQSKFEAVSGEWRYEISDKRGRLFVRLGKTQKDDEPHIVLTLTARGPVASEAGLLLDGGLALGHETITKAFLDLTTKEAQRTWRSEHANSSAS